MNERIRELARQSGGIDMTNHVAGGITTWVGTGTPEFLEKFAELIVRECARQLDDGAEDGMWARSVLYKHFGVEETK